MTNAIPFDVWLNKQGDNVGLAMGDGHPETLILVDMTTMHVYKYVPAENQDGTRDTIHELLSKIGPSNETREFVSRWHDDEQLDFKVTKASELKAVDAKLQELILDTAKLRKLLRGIDSEWLDKQLRTRLTDYGAIGNRGNE